MTRNLLLDISRSQPDSRALGLGSNKQQYCEHIPITQYLGISGPRKSKLWNLEMMFGPCYQAPPATWNCLQPAVRYVPWVHSQELTGRFGFTFPRKAKENRWDNQPATCTGESKPLGKNANNINKSFSVAMFFCIYNRCFCRVNATFNKVLRLNWCQILDILPQKWYFDPHGESSFPSNWQKDMNHKTA